MSKIYHNPRCSKSRQTLSMLEEKGVKPEVVDYLKNPPSRDELVRIIEMLKISPYELLRRGESIFKEKYKGKDLSDHDWIDAMVKHPILIERPIFVNNKKAVLGRPPENILNIL